MDEGGPQREKPHRNVFLILMELKSCRGHLRQTSPCTDGQMEAQRWGETGAR